MPTDQTPEEIAATVFDMWELEPLIDSIAAAIRWEPLINSIAAAIRDAERRGAEKLREAAAQTIWDFDWPGTDEELVKRAVFVSKLCSKVSALPLPGDKEPDHAD